MHPANLSGAVPNLDSFTTEVLLGMLNRLNVVSSLEVVWWAAYPPV
jgi:hypothetical protein